jgi:hypothetical protein
MNQNFFQDMQEGASAVQDVTAMTHTLGELNMNFSVLEIFLTVGSWTYTTVSCFMTNILIFMYDMLL